MVWALLPLKDLVKAKTRLSGVLAPHERRALAQAMVEDVLSVLVTLEELEGILLVSDDPAAELLSHKYAIECVAESQLGCRGLNQAITAAAALLSDRGVTDIMVLHGDIPLLKARELQELLALYQEEGCDQVIAPDLAGRGTNVMVFPTSPMPEFYYGPGSCQAHSAGARDRGLEVTLLNRAGLALDVDSPGDVLHLYHELQALGRDTYCGRLLLAADLAQRLSVMERSGMGLDTGLEDHDAV